MKGNQVGVSVHLYGQNLEEIIRAIRQQVKSTEVGVKVKSIDHTSMEGILLSYIDNIKFEFKKNTGGKVVQGKVI